jgi:hypothetical protein
MYRVSYSSPNNFLIIKRENRFKGIQNFNRKKSQYEVVGRQLPLLFFAFFLGFFALFLKFFTQWDILHGGKRTHLQGYKDFQYQYAFHLQFIKYLINRVKWLRASP